MINSPFFQNIVAALDHEAPTEEHPVIVRGIGEALQRMLSLETETLAVHCYPQSRFSFCFEVLGWWSSPAEVVVDSHWSIFSNDPQDSTVDIAPRLSGGGTEKSLTPVQFAERMRAVSGYLFEIVSFCEQHKQQIAVAAKTRYTGWNDAQKKFMQETEARKSADSAITETAASRIISAASRAAKAGEPQRLTFRARGEQNTFSYLVRHDEARGRLLVMREDVQQGDYRVARATAVAQIAAFAAEQIAS
jgi:hypothetical protein